MRAHIWIALVECFREGCRRGKLVCAKLQICFYTLSSQFCNLIRTPITAAANAVHQQASTRTQFFDCSKQEDGTYPHPTDCGRYISCKDGIETEKDCPICSIDPIRCPHGRLVYDPTWKECLWANEAKCEVEEGDDKESNYHYSSGNPIHMILRW
jgi:hypothetical protein